VAVGGPGAEEGQELPGAVGFRLGRLGRLGQRRAGCGGGRELAGSQAAVRSGVTSRPGPGSAATYSTDLAQH
jgi:hypothetical protein